MTSADPAIKFQRERAQAIFEEIAPLLKKHWEEIAHYKDIPLEPDFDLYKRIEDTGGLRAFTARDEAGAVVGYAVFFLKTNPHYKSSLQAVQDVIFIDKERRGFGRHFIAWCDEQLKADGAEAVYHHVKSAHNWGSVLEKMGYQLVDLIYARRL
jgi:GNAT superfamily N-acetyltransferase